MPDYPFDEQYDSFAFNSLLTREESIQAIGKVGTECGKVAAMSLFHVPTAKHMRLEEFEQTQSQATSQVQKLPVLVERTHKTEFMYANNIQSHTLCPFSGFTFPERQLDHYSQSCDSYESTRCWKGLVQHS